LLLDVARLERDYYERKPDPGEPQQRVSFGTSGHRGSPLEGTFTEAHAPAVRFSCPWKPPGAMVAAMTCIPTPGLRLLSTGGALTRTEPRCAPLECRND
jgi:hypothetical protein